MSDLIESLKFSIEVVGKLRALNKKVGEADFRMLLADLTDALGNAKLDAANLKIEIAELKETNMALNEQLKKKSDETPALDDGAYVFGDDGRHYCTGCYDTQNRKVLLTLQSGPFTVFGKWNCPSCKQHFGPSSH